MRKKIRILAFALSLCLALSGCGLIRRGLGASAAETVESTEKKDEPRYPEADGRYVVCLDAGHGFRDIGCDTELLLGTEADVTLDIVKLLKSELEERGVEVILTHDGESYPSAEHIKSLADDAGVGYIEEDMIENDIFSAYERAIYTSAIAEDKGIDLFLSLHVNSIEGHPEMSQYEMDYYKNNPYSEALGVFCQKLADRLDNKSRIFADEYEDAFLVTKHGSHPSVLIEMGYATNKTDAEKLNSPEWRGEFATTLADCVVEWISSYEEK